MADKEEYKHSDLTGNIIKCAYKVHDFLGLGFPEIIYHRALAIELNKAGINFQRELEVAIFYRDHIEPIGTRRVDFLIEGIVLVEIKAVGQLDDAHVNQILNYLKAYKMELGLLINFGESSLKVKRYIL